MEIKINGQIVEAEAGELLLNVALRNGIEIPHFCYHPCLSIAGNCRICLVKVEGQPKLAPSCNLTVMDGMEVTTDSPEVQAAREDVMQFILLNHPVDCGICDKAGECRLQNYQIKYGNIDPLALEHRHPKPKFYDISERILHDAERCILCSRCVRFTHEISKSEQLGIVERGHNSRVERLADKPVDDPYSDNVISICPVGALLSRDFLYQSRVWYLESVRSVCTGCSRCCSINVWRRNRHWFMYNLDPALNRKAYRVTPCENEAINGQWLCNKGFDQHKLHDRPRALAPLVNGTKATDAEMLKAAKDLVNKAVKPAAIVSSQASNEELQAFKSALGNVFTVYTRADFAPQAGEVVEDEFLIRADKNPNGLTAKRLFGEGKFNPTTGHDLVLAWGDNLNYAELSGAPVIHLGSASGQEQQAAVFVPISTTFERSGTFTNCEGVDNSFDQVFEKPAEVLHAEDFFRRLSE
jgi:NADH-quinone oxidoreductase subunit G